MQRKVIQVNFQQSRLASTQRAATVWTREELRAWQTIAQRPNGLRSVIYLVVAAGLHAAAILGVQLLKPPTRFDAEPDEGGQGGTARVTFFEDSKSLSSEEGVPEEQVYPNKPADAPVITGPSTSAARPARPATSPEAATRAKEQAIDFGATDRNSRVKISQERVQEPIPQSIETRPPSAELEAQSSQLATDASIGFSNNLRDLLPNSMSEYVAAQRRVGSIYGQGAVGGDVAPEADGPVGFQAPDRKKVVVQRYNYAAYFLSLDRRFSDAWGGERFLPRGSTFVGTTGEFIEYDIVINRDGSLVKIINISKQGQPDRDFSSVDRLVNEVFSHVFPMEPVPMRIRDTPLILRKRIQFSGYRYFMF